MDIEWGQSDAVSSGEGGLKGGRTGRLIWGKGWDSVVENEGIVQYPLWNLWVHDPTMKSSRACSAVITEDDDAPSPAPSLPSRWVEEDDAAAAALSFCITKKGFTPLPLSMKDLPLSISALLSDCSCIG